jgi:4-hydroxy-2-oxoheptanedioate aldolase
MLGEQLSAQSITFGGWLAIPEPLIVEAAAKAGFDWIGIDLQHGAWDLGTAFRGIQLVDAFGKRVLIRLGDEDLPLIPRVLDHGASGIVLAMASDPDVVARAIERARYQPEGLRSYGGQRYGMRPEPADKSAVRPAILPMIETRRGLDAVKEIAAVPGVSGLHIGPADLALGLRISRSSPEFAAAVATIISAAHANGLPATMHAVAADQASLWVGMGLDELVLTTDIDLLRLAFGRLIGEARARTSEGQIAPAR